jgi:Flp pilus assembly protein CpaB
MALKSIQTLSPKNNFQMSLVRKLFCVINVFLVSILLLEDNLKAQASTLNEGQKPISAQQDSSNVEVLVPLYRIKKGQPLSEEMFKTSLVPENQVPMGAMLASFKGILAKKYAGKLINANVVLLKEDVVDVEPLGVIDIPVGYKLVTISIDSQSGVEGWAKPHIRVDVNWRSRKDGETQLVAPLIRFVKVISVSDGDAGAQNKEQSSAYVESKKLTVSLLVTEKQSGYIEAVKDNGEFSLVLVGSAELAPPFDPSPRPLSSFVGTKQELATKESALGVEPDGVMFSTNSVTGKKTKYIFKNGRWTIDKDSKSNI